MKAIGKLASGLALILSTCISLTSGLENLKTEWDAYQSALVIPEVIDMTEGGNLNMRIEKGFHNWTEDGSLSGEIYGYGSMDNDSSVTFPGPTIKVARNTPISITWHNKLQQPHILNNFVESSLLHDTSKCWPFCGIPVVVHVHGMESPAKFDGLPQQSIYANQSRTATYLNQQSGSTKTYHDHAMGLTRLNTWAGLVGMYIIEDKELDEKYNVNTEFDIPLMFSDRLIDTSGKLLYSDDNCQTGTKWIAESFGIVNLVNGVVMPYVKVPSAQVRFRLVNVANARNYNFTIPFADKCQTVAKDSGFVQVPEQVDTYVNIYPFERLEWICDFSEDKDGTLYEIVDEPTVEQDLPYDPRVMQIQIDESLVTETMVKREIPKTLTKLKSLKTLHEETQGKTRLVFLGEMYAGVLCPSKSLIRYRNKEINASTPLMGSLACTKGKVERWVFKNPTDDPHPFHWHLVNAQCGPTEDEIDTNSMKDVALIQNAGDRPPETITSVCYVACTPDEFLIEGSKRGPTDYNFDTKDPYVAHCHILEHEENMMMATFRLTDVDDDAPFDDGTVNVTGVLNTEVVATAMGMSVLGAIAFTAAVFVISVESLMFLASKKSLAIAFSLSAGVMVFISFADLFPEAIQYFRSSFTVGGTPDPEAYEWGGDPLGGGVCNATCVGHAWLATTLFFFLGVIIIVAVEYIVHTCLGHHNQEIDHDHHQHSQSPVPEAAHEIMVSPAVGSPGKSTSTLLSESNELKKEYKRAGMLTGIAIAIHNFPEGLALFISCLQGLRTGIVLSVGIILHNLPEGVAVAAPVYYATGSKWDAFKWTAFGGIALPGGAAIGWLVASTGMSFFLQGALYASVGGMLTTITVHELLPGAYKVDPKGKYTVPGFMLGIGIIATGLILIRYAG